MPRRSEHGIAGLDPVNTFMRTPDPFQHRELMVLKCHFSVGCSDKATGTGVMYGFQVS